MSVLSNYQELLKARGYEADHAQLAAVTRLQQCFDDWLDYQHARTKLLTRLFSRPATPRGVYLWGGVGRGKSFIMDSFYQTLTFSKKIRIHFHEFMRSIHRDLEHLKGMSDPLNEVAKRTAEKYQMICFDEFHISDIADAMILHRLLDQLFKHGVGFVMTSNYPPDMLYPEGLHRDRVLPAIELLKQHLDVLNVDAGIDYRKRSLEQIPMYLLIDVAQPEVCDAILTNNFEQISESQDESPVLHIEAREIKAIRRAGGVVWFDFATLCEGPRSQNDYLEIAQQFHTVILSGVPQMSAAMSSAARRFTWLIDVFYDHKIKLMMSAACPPESLYLAGALANEFHRTVSRIIEMQSKEYAQSHKTAIVLA